MTGITGQARSHRPFPPDAPGAYVCGGFRSVSPSGSLLPRRTCLVEIEVAGVGRVTGGWSKYCTHAFITKAALLDHTLSAPLYRVEGSPFEVCCFTGVRQLALGWTILPVVVGSEPTTTMASISVATMVTGQNGASLTTISATRSGRAPTIVLMEFIVMPGEERDCMLGLDALRQLGMSPPDHMLYLPPPPALSPEVDPLAAFRRACLEAHCAAGRSRLSFFLAPQGRLKPRVMFGLGGIVSTIAGALVVDSTTPQDPLGRRSPRIIQVVEGSRGDVLLSSGQATALEVLRMSWLRRYGLANDGPAPEPERQQPEVQQEEARWLEDLVKPEPIFIKTEDDHGSRHEQQPHVSQGQQLKRTEEEEESSSGSPDGKVEEEEMRQARRPGRKRPRHA